MKKKIIPENFSLLSQVSLTPLTNIHSQLSPRNFEINRKSQWHNQGRGQGYTDLRKKPVPEIIDPVFTKTSQNARFLLKVPSHQFRSA
jgi:hypothetical protein